jgi:uncharacterized membrane protein
MNESLWLDEATTALVSRMSITEILTKFLPGDFHPPLYYLFMKFWVGVFGSSEIALRSPSLIFAALTVFLVYKMFGKVAAIFLATAPLLFYYSQEARMYSMTLFLVTLSVFSFVKILKESRLGDWINFSLSLALVAMTDYVAILILPIFWIYGGTLSKEFSWWKKFFMSHIILGVFGALWLPYFLKQISSGQSALTNSPAWAQILGVASVKNFLLIPIKFMIGRVGFDNNYLYAAIVGILSVIFGYLLIKSRKEPRIAWLWLEIPLALGILISFKFPILAYFRFLFILPAFYILAAEGIKRTGKYSKLLMYGIIIANVLCISYYLLTPKFQREDWRGAADAIGEDYVIFPANSQKEALSYYGKGNQVLDIDSFDGGKKEIWLSRYVWQLFDSGDLVRQKIESLGYNKTQEFNFNGVELWKYENSN